MEYLGLPLMGSEPLATARAVAQLAELARVEVSTSRLAAASRAIIGGCHDQPVGGQLGRDDFARSAT